MSLDYSVVVMHVEHIHTHTHTHTHTHIEGDILSPLLFLVCLKSIWKRAVIPGDGWQVTQGG